MSGYIFQALGDTALENADNLSREQREKRLLEQCNERKEKLQIEVEQARKVYMVEKETTNEVQLLSQEAIYPSQELAQIRSEYDHLEYERLRRMGSLDIKEESVESPSSSHGSPKLMSEGQGHFRHGVETRIESELELRFAICKRDILRERRVKEMRYRKD